MPSCEEILVTVTLVLVVLILADTALRIVELTVEAKKLNAQNWEKRYKDCQKAYTKARQEIKEFNK